MEVLSDDFKRLLLESMDSAWNEKLNLEKEHLKTKDFLTQAEALAEFSISRPTIAKWEKLGLRRFQPPIEGTKNVYYRKSDIINFLSV